MSAECSGGTSNLGNGSLTFSSLTWQRWAMSQVRSSGVFQFAEQLHHLVARFQVEIGRVPMHAVGVAHRLAGLDAEQDFVGARVFLAQVVGIVGGHQRQAGFLREAVQLRREPAVLLQVMVLHFEEEVVAAEDVGVGVAPGAWRRRTCRRGWSPECGRAGRRTCR